MKKYFLILLMFSNLTFALEQNKISYLEIVPREILVHIFSYCEDNEVIQALFLLNKKSNALLLVSLSSLKFGDKYGINIAKYNIFSNLTNLLIEDNNELRNVDIGYLGFIFENLKSLSISRCMNISYRGIKHLTNYKNLKKISLIGYFPQKFDCEKSFKYIFKLTNIESLTFSNCLGFDNNFKDIGALTNLRHLNLNHCYLNDSDLQNLSDLTKLKSINIQACGITDKGLEHLSLLTNLKLLISK